MCEILWVEFDRILEREPMSHGPHRTMFHIFTRPRFQWWLQVLLANSRLLHAASSAMQIFCVTSPGAVKGRTCFPKKKIISGTLGTQGLFETMVCDKFNQNDRFPHNSLIWKRRLNMQFFCVWRTLTDRGEIFHKYDDERSRRRYSGIRVHTYFWFPEFVEFKERAECIELPSGSGRRECSSEIVFHKPEARMTLGYATCFKLNLVGTVLWSWSKGNEIVPTSEGLQL